MQQAALQKRPARATLAAEPAVSLAAARRETSVSRTTLRDWIAEELLQVVGSGPRGAKLVLIRDVVELRDRERPPSKRQLRANRLAREADDRVGWIPLREAERRYSVPLSVLQRARDDGLFETRAGRVRFDQREALVEDAKLRRLVEEWDVACEACGKKTLPLRRWHADCVGQAAAAASRASWEDPERARVRRHAFQRSIRAWWASTEGQAWRQELSRRKRIYWQDDGKRRVAAARRRAWLATEAGEAWRARMSDLMRDVKPRHLETRTCSLCRTGSVERWPSQFTRADAEKRRVICDECVASFKSALGRAVAAAGGANRQAPLSSASREAFKRVLAVGEELEQGVLARFGSRHGVRPEIALDLAIEAFFVWARFTDQEILRLICAELGEPLNPEYVRTRRKRGNIIRRK